MWVKLPVNITQQHISEGIRLNIFPIDLAVRDAMETRYKRQFVAESTVCMMKVTDVTGRYAPRYCSHGPEVVAMNAEFNALMAKKYIINGLDRSTKNRLNLFTASPIDITIVINNPDLPGVYDYNAKKVALDKKERQPRKPRVPKKPKYEAPAFSL